MAKKLSLLTAVLAFAVCPAQAAPVFWTENGHYYEAVPREGNWQQASDLALRSLGYLVTVGDAAENIFAFNLVDTPQYWIDTGSTQVGPWIGGLQAPLSTEPDGGWKWVTGEAFTYTAWREGEPNNVGGGEDRVNFMGAADAGRGPFWNDAGGGSAMQGLVVEWDVLPGWRFGDFNASGHVDLNDFGVLKANFGTGTQPAQGNANFDDVIDLADFSIVKDNFATSPSAMVGSVPEPSGLALALMGGIVTLLLRTRKR